MRLSPLRRVRIDDEVSARIHDYESDRLQEGDDIVLDPDVYEAAERERLLAEEREAVRRHTDLERRAYEDEIADGGGIGRDRDLEAGTSELGTPRKPERVLTEQQRRAQATFGTISSGKPRADETELRTSIREAALSLRGRDRHFKEDRETQEAGRPAGEWLEANDPQLTRDGITAELATAFEAFGLSLEDVRHGAFPNGRPNAAAREMRTKVRAALLPIYDADRKRVLLSEVLGCSRQALHKLMSAEMETLTLSR